MYRTKFDEEKKLWSNFDLPELYNPTISVAHVVLRAMKVNGSRIAQINADTGTQFTYKEIYDKTIRAAQNLQKRGYVPKQVFAFMVKNTDDVTPLVFAAFSTACLPEMCNNSLSKKDMVPIFQRSQPSIVFCEVEFYDIINESSQEAGIVVKIFTLNGVKGDSEPVENLFVKTGTEDCFIPIQVDGINDAAIKMCSSGTSGPAKGVLLSHAAIISSIIRYDLINSDDVLLSMNSMDWISSLLILLMSTFNGAIRVITSQSYSPDRQLHLIEKYKISFLITPPFQMVSNLKSGLMSKEKLSSIRLQSVGGAKVPFAALNEYNSYLINGCASALYGLSEFSGILSHDYPPSGKDSIGQLANGCILKIIDENGDRCGIDTDGEFYFKTTYKFLGYHECKDLTKESIDDEGFFRTGDIGHMDKDGNLFIVDRAKDLLKYYSLKFSPSNVESFLTTMPEIQAVCVTGIPDDLAGDLPAAVVVRKNNSKISEDHICQVIADNFPDNYKLRGGVYFVENIPITRTGKILRRKAREIAMERFKGSSVFETLTTEK